MGDHHKSDREKKRKYQEQIETILDNDDMKIQKFNLNNMTKEEAQEIFEEKILNKMFD